MLCPAVHPLDEGAVHALTVLPVTAGRTLCDDGNEMESWLHRHGGIGFAPGHDFAIEPREHRVGREGAEDAHALRKRIPIEGNDAMAGENRSR